MPKETKSSLARKWKVARSTLDEWLAEGVDIFNEDELRAKLAGRNKTSGKAESIENAKQRKLEAEATLAEIKVEVERGRYISKESQLQAGMKAGLLIRSAFMRLRSDLPPLVVGLPSGKVAKVLEEYGRDKLNEISAGFEELGIALADGPIDGDETAGKPSAPRVGRKKRTPSKQPARRKVSRKRRPSA